MSGTEPPPKINSVPASLCLSSGRPLGSHNTSTSGGSSRSTEESGAMAGRHRNNMSSASSLPNGSTAPEIWQTVCCPARAVVYFALTHIHTRMHAYINIQARTNFNCPLPATYRAALERLGGPIMKTVRGARDNVGPDLWSQTRLPS